MLFKNFPLFCDIVKDNFWNLCALPTCKLAEGLLFNVLLTKCRAFLVKSMLADKFIQYIWVVEVMAAGDKMPRRLRGEYLGHIQS